MIQKYDVVSVAVPILGIASLVVGVRMGWLPLSDIQSAIPYIVFTIIIGVFLWGQQRRLDKALGKKVEPEVVKSKPYDPDDRFEYLTVHYLRVRGSQDVPDPSRPRCLVDGRAKVASWVIPEWLEPFVIDHKILWQPYDDEKTLRTYIKERYSLSQILLTPEDLRLQYVKGELRERGKEEYSDLITRLKGRKLENLQVVYLTRRHPFARRTLLVDFDAKTVWLSPLYDFELIANGLVTSETYGMWPLESCDCFCKRKFHFPLVPQRYPESKLFVEGA